MHQRVTLLNPPADRLYIRDQFCSHVSKGTYYWQPLDLLMVSARLSADGYDLQVVDAVVEGLDATATRARIDGFAPDAVVFLTGSDSFDDDIALIGELKRQGKIKLAVGIGDVLREKGDALMQSHPALDACLLDFVDHGLSAFLAGRSGEATNMRVRIDGKIQHIEAGQRPRTFTIPTPRYDLFPLTHYRMPYNKYHPYASLIASSWCPYGCSFCPFARTPYKVRDVESTLVNLEDIRRLGIRQVHFADWTFGVDRRQAKAIVEGMIQAKFGFTWSCLSRVDLVDRELLTLYKKSGCELIELGVESANQEILDRYEKGITLAQIRNAFGWARELDLSTLATFVFGLPGETPADLERTLDLALEIEPTFCSFNVASPRMGTELRRDMISSGLIEDGSTARLDSSRSRPAFSTEQLSADQLEVFRRRAIRRFYLRPSYVMRRLSHLGSLRELQNHLGNGLSLVRQTMARSRA